MIDVILVEPLYPGNIGSVCRVMANFDFGNLIIVNPKCKVTSPDTYRMAKHADNIVNSAKIVSKIPKYDILIGTTAKVFDDYNVRRSPIIPKELAEKIKGIDLQSKKTKIGILFGRESSGLTNKEIDKCDILVTIPSSEKYASMNLSHAVAIILYEMYDLNNKRIRITIPLANNDERAQMEKMINKIISTLGFQTPEKRKVQKQIWKNIFNKSLMTKREANGAMGLLSRVIRLSKIKANKNKSK